MHSFDITILTESRYDNPDNPDEMIKEFLLEDELLKQELEKRGLRVTRKDWADPHFDWSSTQYAIFRTTWDYFHKFEQFKNWLASTRTKTNFLNTIETVIWNMDKHYLLDMQEKGINIPESIFVHKGDQITLRDLLENTGWNDCILKPTIAGTARHTYRLNLYNVNDHEELFQELIAQEDMMLQVFVDSILTDGEISLVVINGIYSHAILKKAQAGDFRVQGNFGGSVQVYEPTKEEIAFAEKAMALCDPVPLYARVDIMYDNNRQLALGELELIEPELWFREKPEAAAKLADAVIDHIT